MKEEFNYVAKGLPAGTARKLVFLLHGVGLNATVMDKLAQDIAGVLPDAAIIMPHGPETYAPPPAQEDDLLKAPKILGGAANDNTARQWFDIGGNATTVRAKLVCTADKMNLFIDSLRDTFNVQDKDIAIMGFSQGGGVALYTAFLREQEIGCAIGHSTIFFKEPNLKSKPPTLYLYGNADAEFSMPAYAESARHLTEHVPAAQIVEVAGLQHRTSTESRRLVAEFIRDKLAPTAP